MEQYRETLIKQLAHTMERMLDEAPWEDWNVLLEDLEKSFLIKLTKPQKLSIAKRLAERDIY
jgi:hypothetical protein